MPSNTSPSTKSRLLPRVLGAVQLMAILVLLAGALAILVPRALGYQMHVIVGGSMSGTIERGSLLYTKSVPTADLAVGDIITYVPPAGQGPLANQPVTHRIVEMTRTDGKTMLYRTKGDANRQADSWQFKIPQATQSRYAYAVPHVGTVYEALSDARLRLLLFSLPFALACLLVLRNLWTLTSQDASKERGAETPDSGEHHE